MLKAIASKMAVFIASGMSLNFSIAFHTPAMAASYLIPYVKIASISIVIAIMIGALARHILITYLAIWYYVNTLNQKI